MEQATETLLLWHLGLFSIQLVVMKRSDLALTIHSLPDQWHRTEKNAEIAHPLHLAHLGNGNTNTGTKLEELFPK